MALQPQVVDLNLAVGVDDKSDSKVVAVGSNAEVENGFFTKEGRVDKLNDADTSTLLITASSHRVFETGTAFMHGGQLIMEGNFLSNVTSRGAATGFARYDPIQAAYIHDTTQDYAPASRSRVRRLAGSGDSVTKCSSAYALGTTIHAWTDTTGYGTFVRYVVFKTSTGELLATGSAGTATTAKCTAIRDSGNETLIVVYKAGSTINFFRFAIADGSSSTVTSTANPSASLWDVCHRSSTSYIFDLYWYDSGSADIRHIAYNNDGTVAEAEAQLINEVAKNAFSATYGVNQQTLCWQNNTTSYPRTATVGASGNSTSALTYGPFDVSATTTAIVRIAGVERNLQQQISIIAVEYAAAGAVPSYVFMQDMFFHNGTLIATASPLYHATIVAKPFQHSDTASFIIGSTQEFSRTVYLLTAVEGSARKWHCVGRMLYSRGPEIAATGYLSETMEGADNDFVFGTTRQLRLQGDGVLVAQAVEGSFQLGGQAKQTLDLTGLTIRSGAYVASFDDAAYIPTGPLEQPEISSSASGAGTLLAGTYNHRVVIEWQDGQGNICRSAPSQALEIILAGTNNVDITVYPPIPWAFYMINRAKIHAYRTVAGPGTVYYKTAEVIYDGATFPLVITDDTADSALTDNEQLYTTGGVFSNSPPPPSEAIALSGGRVWAIPSDSPYEVWVSKSKIEGVGLEFSDLIVKSLPFEGAVVDIAAMDGQIFFFTETSIYRMQAVAPIKTGAGAFGQVALVAAKHGCAAPNGTIVTPDGIMFASARGIYLLDRAMQLQFIGAAVESTTLTHTITKIVYRNDRDEVWFLAGNDASAGRPTILIYNRHFRRWSKSQEYAGILRARDIVIDPDGKYRMFQNSTNQPAVVHTEDLTDWTNTTFKIVSPWLKFGAYQDLKRLWKATFLGEWRSACDIVLKVYVDYDDTTAVDTQTFDLSTGYTLGEPIQVRFHMARQEAQAWKFEIYDGTLAGTGEGFRPTTLTLEFGKGQSGVKLPAAISL